MTDTGTITSYEYCTAVVGPLLIGIGVDRVREVFSRDRCTAVPRSGWYIAGLINLRGQVIAAIDLRRRFEVDPGPVNENIHIVVDYGGDLVSLIVDDVRDVVTVRDEAYEPNPETVGPTTRQLLLGAYKLDDGLLLPLDTDMTIATSVKQDKGLEE